MNSQMNESQGEVGEGPTRRNFCSHELDVSPPGVDVFTSLEALRTHTFEFYRGFLT